MSQLIKHYWKSLETGDWSINSRFDLISPGIAGLEVKYELTDENDIPYCLSVVPDDVDLSQMVGDGLQFITQEEWDIEINSFDARQQEKRNEFLLGIENDFLNIINSPELESLNQEIGNSSLAEAFPSAFSNISVEIENNSEVQEFFNKLEEIKEISMINDPLKDVSGFYSSGGSAGAAPSRPTPDSISD